MKNIIKTMSLCMVAAVALSSCYSVMDDKDEYDLQSAVSTVPVLEGAEGVAPTPNTITLTGSTNTVTNVLERGFMVSTSEDFAEAKTYVANAEEFPEAGRFVVSFNAEAETTYFYKMFVTMLDGKVYYGEVKTVKTPAANIFTVEGIYTVTEFEQGDDGSFAPEEETYKLLIQFAEGSDSEVEITNIWDGGETVIGIYDAESNTISVPSGQTIFVHPSYGDVAMMGLNESITNYVQNVTFKFNPAGGKIVTTPWSAEVSAGMFGIYYMQMTHDPEN